VTDSRNILEDTMAALPELSVHHAPTSATYRVLKRVTRPEAERLFGPDGPQAASLGPLGTIRFPYHRMGAIDSIDLFGVDELIIMSFYDLNRARYRRVLDLGANIGLHSFALSRCGYEVRCYEPDPVHFKLLSRTIELNKLSGITPVNAAVSVADGTHEFVRVLGNTTGSHLAGAKTDPYGDLERFTVKVEAFKPLLHWADLAKIDIEGHEATVLCSTTAEDWAKTDAIAEIGNEPNAEAVFKHFQSIGIGMFAQKTGWSKVETLSDMPTSHRDGSLFITKKEAVPWSRAG
jgi:FkbM family methyltransferase